MCPVCLANAALIAAGATSSGGVAAFVAGRFLRGKKRTKRRKTKWNEREQQQNSR
jgi:membrane protein YqaA with SNARE-associated domain